MRKQSESCRCRHSLLANRRLQNIQCLETGRESVYIDRIHFAFSSAYPIKPSPNVVSDDETSPESDSEDDDEWFSPGPPAEDDHPNGSFGLWMMLSYYDGKGVAEIVVYEGSSPDRLSYTVRRKDGTRPVVHDSHLHLKLQPDLSNNPTTPLAFQNEVDKGISKEEAQLMARP